MTPLTLLLVGLAHADPNCAYIPLASAMPDWEALPPAVQVEYAVSVAAEKPHSRVDPEDHMGWWAALPHASRRRFLRGALFQHRLAMHAWRNVVETQWDVLQAGCEDPEPLVKAMRRLFFGGRLDPTALLSTREENGLREAAARRRLVIAAPVLAPDMLAVERMIRSMRYEANQRRMRPRMIPDGDPNRGFVRPSPTIVVDGGEHHPAPPRRGLLMRPIPAGERLQPEQQPPSGLARWASWFGQVARELVWGRPQTRSDLRGTVLASL